MKKRIFILILNFIFLVSTTGLPVTINLCKMNAEEADQCTMHQKPVKSMCCMEVEMKNELSFSKVTPNCCQVSFVYNKVESEFVNNKTELSSYYSLLYQVSLVSIIPNQVELSTNELYYTDSSPPFLINPELQIINSSLLI